MKFFRFLFSLLMTVGLIYLLNNRLADIPFLKKIESLKATPALGKLLNPFGGFWKNAEAKNAPKISRLYLDSLDNQVDILLDDRLIPHIFARSEKDLYFAQGYITARYRLWQMDFLTYVAAGRLSEIFGVGDALEYDKTQRRIGMLYAAEKAVEEIQKDPLAKSVIDAYIQGVNTYIRELSPKDYPIEYKLLDYKPEIWTPIKVALIQKYMAQDLAFRTEDLQLTKILQKYGTEITESLFKGYTDLQDPTIPPGTPFDFKKLEVPKVPREISYPLELKDKSQTLLPEDYETGLGSNNWAIGADKSATGYPIVCNDPHLGLKLPSIWFEIQLVGPKVNVYGASLPGTPGVIIGFNKEVCWGVTNVDSDVTDWYKIQFQDNKREAYKYGEEWRKVERRIENIKIRNAPSLMDTVLYTHHGPIAAQEKEKQFAAKNNFPTDAAFRWLAHDASNDLVTFYKLNRARNYQDYREALVHYSCPAQNFIFADVHKDIAITPNGKFPLKWKNQGKFVLDGSNPEHDWQGWIPADQNPHVKNPERGFVSSANQFPVVDSIYPYYLHWNFDPYDRGRRINERLERIDSVGVEEMRLLQIDNLGLLAKDILPSMLKYLDKKILKTEAREALSLLQDWDYRYKADLIAPTVFHVWWNSLNDAIWKDEFGEGMVYPPKDVTQKLVARGDSLSPVKWFDNVQTKPIETLKDLMRQSYDTAIQELRKRGALGQAWQWAVYRDTKINHIIARFEPFNSPRIQSGGAKGTVNALGPVSGPSWRMVVQLGINPKAFVVYPGGQSGNPGSFYYDNFLQTWSKGELYEALYMTNSKQNSDRIISTLKLVK
ncbi:MAG: penicillin acylase family protein [Microscillaceae bacterium]|nr:penicillin acylase family protein [Microscillaceae bacterium]